MFPNQELEREMIAAAERAGGDVECHVKALLAENERLRRQHREELAEIKKTLEMLKEHVSIEVPIGCFDEEFSLVEKIVEPREP